jgi:hypothetical protein
MKKVVLTLVLSVCLVGCGLSAVLSEIATSITKFAPLLSAAQGVVCAISGPGCLAVEAFVHIALPFSGEVSQAFSVWSTASAAAQPGKLPQVIAALQAWQTQLQKGLTIPGLSASQQIQYNGIIQAELGAVADLLVTLQAAEKNGGTTAALAQLINEAEPAYEPNQFAVWIPFRAPRTLKLKNGAVIHTWAYHKSVLVEKLSKKTGDAQVDKASETALALIKKLG